MKSNNIVFLYTELAGYTLACLKEVTKQGVNVHLFNYPVNREAPFEFKPEPGITFYNRFNYKLLELQARISEINPSVIVCSGWIDKDYLKVCGFWSNKCKTVLALDTKWEGWWRQYLATFISPFAIKRNFHYAWVPGTLQAIYAKKLGFKKSNIYKGFYACDFAAFHLHYIVNKVEKANKFPHRFIYIGRYYNFKGIQDLWKAFIELQEDFPTDWELWCLGTGDLEPVVHPKIKHFGFIQPDEIENFVSNTGVFVLPSYEEPWGVVVHEFAAAGFPLICSDKVGAVEAFLQQSINGYTFKAGSITDLKNKMLQVVKCKDEVLYEMGAKSAAIAHIITPKTWADTLVTIAGNNLNFD